jgi:transcription initiation factor TFIID TATA-box-binding protein
MTMMDSLTTHPATALQAKAFTSPQSLSFPGGADLTPPLDGKDLGAGAGNGSSAGLSDKQVHGISTPAETPAAQQAPGMSGIVPTLQ